MATNPTLEGDGTALYVSNLLAGAGVKITVWAWVAIGVGSEFANTQMLADALEGRRSVLRRCGLARPGNWRGQ